MRLTALVSPDIDNKMQLTEKAKQLIPKARIVNFKAWVGNYSPEVRDILQQADDEGRYLSDSELDKIGSKSIEYARLLRDKAPEIVEQAREEVLAQYPNITEMGGDLYPPERAKACWRDFWHFLRCVTYGIVGENSLYTSQEGLNNMKLLYEELKVPLLPMVRGLEGLKFFGLKEFSESEQTKLDPYFQHLIDQMKSFVKE